MLNVFGHLCIRVLIRVFLRAGATGLNAAVQSEVVSLSWRYLPTIIASSLIMLGWALFINNLGRRRYPLHWWAPGPTFVRDPVEEHDESLRRIEGAEIQREQTEEGDLALESDNASSRLERPTPDQDADDANR